MKLFCHIISVALVFVVTGGVKAASESLTEMRALAQASPDNIVELDSDSYRRLVDTPERDYAVALTLTVLHKDYQCEPCHTFEPQLKRVAYSWREEERGDSKLFFARLDFMNAREVFSELKIAQVPVFGFIGPEGTYQSLERYDFSKDGVNAQRIAKWIGTKMGKEFSLREPVDYTQFGLNVAMLLAVIAGLAILSKPILRLFSNRRFWAACSIVTCLMMTSGHMWNQIRGAAFVGRTNEGAVEYISGSFSYQHAFETQLVAVLCTLLLLLLLMIYESVDSVCAFCVVSLCTRIPNISHAQAQRSAVYFTVIVLVAAYSMLLSLLKRKQGGYPFKLLF